jgi:beta-N-acetylhexosaminidase
VTRRLLLPLVLCAALAAQVPKRPAAKSVPAATAVKPPARPAAAAPGPTAPGGDLATRWFHTLTPRERIAQLVIIQFNGHPMNTRTRDYRKFVHLMIQEHIGGLILINTGANGRLVAKADPLEAASFVNRMQKLAKTPLLVAGDFERGASMRIEATTAFPHAMAFTATRDPELARAEGQITAKESRALGFQWIFFPDADVNNNPDNPVINTRSYGENPEDVSKMVSAFIEGAHSVPSARVLVTAKHFPGHGDTATDTHLNMATISGDRERLESVEWVPFRAAIKSGVDSIMSAHLAVPALDAPDLPATLSPKILTGVLRKDLGFKGLVVTDALEMGGIAHGFTVGEAAVRAIEAGADVLLMPSDPEAAINAVDAAVKSGRIPQKRIDESAMRLLQAKARLGLGTKKLVDLDDIYNVVNAPESVDVAQEVADRAVTLVRNKDDLVPLKSPQSTAFFLLGESRTGTEGQQMALEIKKRSASAMVIQLDPTMSDADLQAAAERANGASSYVVAAFLSSATLRGSYPSLIRSLGAKGKPIALVALGNPYLLRDFPEVSAYLTTYSSVPVCETSTVKALFGEMNIGGKLPVTIPGLANYGDGIALTARFQGQQDKAGIP